jgi:DNA-binding transcriptional LysR family regulator
MDLDTGRLRSFLEVAERGTVAAAAESLGYTAPAVSQQLAKLESQLGRLLFDRVAGRLRLTDDGEALLPLAHQLIEVAEQIGAAPAHRAKRPLRIAGFATALTTLVVPLLSSPLAKKFSFDVLETDDEVSMRELSLGHIDIAIIQEYDDTRVPRSPRFEYTTLFRDRVRLIAPPSMSSSVTVKGLADGDWLLGGSNTKCQEATMVVLKRAGITPRIVGQIDDNQALLAMVAAGHGATIAPELVVKVAPSTVTIAKEDLRIHRSIIGVTRSSASDGLRDVLTRLARPHR